MAKIFINFSPYYSKRKKAKVQAAKEQAIKDWKTGT